MRVYVPSTVEGLQRLMCNGEIEAHAEGFAATDELLRALDELTEKEIDFLVSSAAAEASLALLGERDASSRRRVVIVTEMPNGAVGEVDQAAGAVVVPTSIGLARVDAVLADTDDVDLTRRPDDALAWFASQEIGDLLA